NSNPPFNVRLVIPNTPLLTMLRNGPLPSDSAGAPSCSAESPLTPPACSIFAPGGVDPSLHTPTTQEWSFEIERGITQELALQLEYVGSQSYHLPASVDMNSIPLVRCTNPAGCLAGGTLAASQWNMVPQGTDYIPAGATRPNRFVGSTQ